MHVADMGDVPIYTFDLKKSLDIITASYVDVLSHDTVPLTLGGDQTVIWPILPASRDKFGPVALVHVEAYADINDEMFGKRWRVDVRFAGLGKTDAGSMTKFVKLTCLARDATPAISIGDDSRGGQPSLWKNAGTSRQPS
jgi:hypothetical protein